MVSELWKVYGFRDGLYREEYWSRNDVNVEATFMGKHVLLIWALLGLVVLTSKGVMGKGI